jgi:hypothetical protein
MAASIRVLWDHSQLWGLLACRGLAAVGADFSPVTCREVAEGALSRDAPRLLVVPGGFARLKHEALGHEGARAVRDYVSGGGGYFGICGGAGLALSHADGLRLCSWTRRTFADRLEHLVSGHVRLRLDPDSALCPPSAPEGLSVPVWWPAGFAPPLGGVDPDVMVAATYVGPGKDLMLADVALGAMDAARLAACRERFGLRLPPAFLDGGACVLSGSFGEGRYVLSHAHLETPDSPGANAWFGHILGLLTREDRLGRAVPAWDPEAEPARFDDPHLAAARRALARAVGAGLDARLLFRRNAWLLGWRPGMPGFSLSSLAGMLAGAAALPPSEAARDYWRQAGPDFVARLEGFVDRLLTFFPAQRLEITLSLVNGPKCPTTDLAAERQELFGSPPGGGGLCGELAATVDELLLRLFS